MKSRFREVLKLPTISIQMIHLKDETIREICLVSGCFLFGYGLGLYSDPLKYIFWGWSLMKFSGLVKKVII
ncbi:MAG: hypothetical protein H0Z28_13405 [Archaeoglobus sp.]|nr:hypothetical protein [Archaeoglobus sp.]